MPSDVAFGLTWPRVGSGLDIEVKLSSSCLSLCCVSLTVRPPTRPSSEGVSEIGKGGSLFVAEGT
jgi:hypothetical protein